MSSLLLTVDALRADHLSQYGYHRDTMPALDTLTDAGGIRFESAFANGTNTGISLPSLLTSRYRGDKHVENGPTIASSLDVTTGAIHSNTYFASKHSQVNGFDWFEDFDIADSNMNDAKTDQQLFRKAMDLVRPIVDKFNARSTAERIQEAIFPKRLIHETTVYKSAERTTNRAIKWIDTVDGEFFLWVHYMDPHRPYGIDLEIPAYGPRIDKREIQELMSVAGISPKEIKDEQQNKIIDLYDSDIRYTSKHIDRLFDALKSRGIWSGLDIILTADHGEEFGEHGCYFHRNRPYDELLHVPMVIKSNSGDRETIATSRQLLDVAPTICGFHGVEPPDSFIGENAFEGDERKVIATGAFSENNHVVAARWDGHKYIRVGDEHELYDLDTDPDEQENIAHEGEAYLVYQNAIPDELVEEGTSGVPDEEDVDKDVADRLKKLGYME